MADGNGGEVAGVSSHCPPPDQAPEMIEIIVAAREREVGRSTFRLKLGSRHRSGRPSGQKLQKLKKGALRAGSPTSTFLPITLGKMEVITKSSGRRDAAYFKDWFMEESTVLNRTFSVGRELGNAVTMRRIF